MSHFSDSRDPVGIGYLILQDHGYKQKGANDYSRAGLVGVRVVGRMDGESEDCRYLEDPSGRGMIGGAYCWSLADEGIGSYQFGWPAIVADTGHRSPLDGSKVERLPGGGLKPLRGGGAGPAGEAQPEARPPAEKAASGGGQPKNKGMSQKELQNKQAKEFKARNTYIPLNTPQGANGGGGGGGGGQWANPWPNAGVVGGAGPNAKPVNLFGQGFQWLNALFQKNIPNIWVVPGTKGDKWGSNKFFEMEQRGIVGIGVDAWNINVAGAASHKDAFKKFSDKQEANDEIYYNFGDDSVSVSASSLSLTTFPAARGWLADGRYKSVTPTKLSGWPDFPKGFVGKVEQASTEDSQDALFLPADPRLIAVHIGNPFSCGTIVTDITGDAFVDIQRGARLHSMLRVVKGPKQTNKPINTASAADREKSALFQHYKRVLGEDQAVEFIGNDPLAVKPALSKNKQNWLAWNIGPSGQRDCYGGLVCDVPDAQTASMSGRTFGVASARFGGPFDIGAENDKHPWGVDADGNKINALHIATLALFRERGSDIYDGPLDFEHAYPQCGDLDYPVRVHLGWNEDNQTWSWWTTNPDTPTPGPTPRDPQPTPEAPPPVTPGGSYGHPKPKVSANRDPVISQMRYARHVETSLPSLAFHAQEYREGKLDFSHSQRVESGDLKRYWETSPMVGRMVAYAAQLAPFDYTQKPGNSTFVGGTANGSVMFLPPEIGIEYQNNSIAPAWVNRSTSYLSVGTGAYFGAGAPDLETGGLHTGYRWGADTNGDLSFSRINDAGEVSGTAVLFRNLCEIVLKVGAFAPADLLSVAAGGQKQIGIRTDAGNEAIAVNIGGTVFTVGVT